MAEGSDLIWPEVAAFQQHRKLARSAAGHARLCLQQRNWRGQLGNWSGSGTGSSIDFQDHRPYLPGDDPRHIDWAAYARSGNYIMKLYREEVSPKVDLILDVSRSMTWQPEKRGRLFELACFCQESAEAMGAALSLTLVAGEAVHALSPAAVHAPVWPVPEKWAPKIGAPLLDRLPLRPGSLRILISDLLYDAAPPVCLRPLVSANGRVTLLVPYSQAEATPDWRGNLTLIDCESGERRRQRVSDGLRRRYADAYMRHMRQWEDAARRHGVRMARVPCEVDFLESLQSEAFGKGVVEAWA